MLNPYLKSWNSPNTSLDRPAQQQHDSGSAVQSLCREKERRSRQGGQNWEKDADQDSDSRFGIFQVGYPQIL